jgi:S1-C subfamily serine protease
MSEMYQPPRPPEAGTGGGPPTLDLGKEGERWGGWPAPDAYWGPPPGGNWGPPAPPGAYWQPEPPRRRGLLVMGILAFVIAVAAVAGVGFSQILTWPAPRSVSTTPPDRGPQLAPGAPSGPASPGPAGSAVPNGPLDRNAVTAAVNPGVVDVNSTLGLQGARAAGTGIVLASSGLVLTNNHVINGATGISVTDVGDGRTYQATVAGYDVSEDIAVLRLANASGLRTVPIGDSGMVRVGDPVIAIGNAGGLGGTPDAAPGTVTALDQAINATDESGATSERLTGLIQVAANVQPGDSGGPLANSTGQVVGIDTAASQGFQIQAAGGQGYAIPINKAVAIANQIRAGQASATVHIGATAFLGVEVTSANGRNRAAVSGAAVGGVVANSPADQAGITGGDVIVSLDGQTIDSPTALTRLMNGHHPGDRVRLGWVDGSGQSLTATLRLANGPAG